MPDLKNHEYGFQSPDYRNINLYFKKFDYGKTHSPSSVYYAQNLGYNQIFTIKLPDLKNNDYGKPIFQVSSARPQISVSIKSRDFVFIIPNLIG